MPNEADPARHYTDREVRLILKTAVEMQQQRADRAGDVSGGMSLVELDEVAVEHFMLKATLFGFAGGLFGTAVTMSAFGPVGIVVGAGTLATGYLWARRGLRSAATRYRARAHELIDAIATRARDIAHGGSA